MNKTQAARNAFYKREYMPFVRNQSELYPMVPQSIVSNYRDYVQRVSAANFARKMKGDDYRNPVWTLQDWVIKGRNGSPSWVKGN